MNHFLNRSLPPGLEKLVDLALDLRWTWSHGTDRLWRTLAPDLWGQTKNPWLLLQRISRRRLDEMARDMDFLDELERFAEARGEYMSGAAWFGEAHRPDDYTIAYFCMEYGLAEALPLYSGGLGILAGDHLKTASDLGVPLVAVGLLYQEGYFRQMLDARGAQLEFYPHNAPGNLPIRALGAADGGLLGVTLRLPGRALLLRVWHAQVGRVSLYLLDSNDPENSPADRGITSKLYGDGIETRLMQEIVLGVGGWRALEAVGVHPDICHLNEGHAALVTLERARRYQERHGVDFWQALWVTRAGNVFTTHTPVAAAFDTYRADLLAKYGTGYAAELGITPDELLALGRRDRHDGDEPFNMTYLAMRTCAAVNAVSALHGQVSRRLFQPLFPRRPEHEVPVGHVTNGVHVPSWDSPWADEVWTDACGKGRWCGALEDMERAMAALDDETLWTLVGEERRDLVAYARKRLARQLGQRGADEETIAMADRTLDPNALTVGFARRFTAYKRPNLLLHDPGRLARLLADRHRPVQLIVAGKAHPHDTEGKRFVEIWAEFMQRADVRAHAVFLEDYDIALAQELVQGVDVWVNTPRRLWEACGTSGMKVLVNGGLNLSELDGWWAEAYASDVGWAIGDGREHHEPGRDAVEAGELYRLLEEEIVPMFYERDAQGIPRAWIARIRKSLASLAPQFSSNRMMREYVEQVYDSAASAVRRRRAENGRIGGELRGWSDELHRQWHEIHFGNFTHERQDDAWRIAVQIYLGELSPESVSVELYADAVGASGPSVQPMERMAGIPGALHAYVYEARVTTPRPASDFTPRVLPRHREARVPLEQNLITWWPGAT